MFKRHKRIIVLIIIAIIFLVLGMYVINRYTALQQSPTDEKVLISSSDLILAVKSSGGMCPDGACWGEQIYRNNGNVIVNKSEKFTLKRDEVQKLKNLIINEDFNAIKSRPFTQMCPTAYDGSASTYYFYTPHGIERIGSCEFEINYKDPLFAYIFELQTKY